jgi:hypothetical protein
MIFLAMDFPMIPNPIYPTFNDILYPFDIQSILASALQADGIITGEKKPLDRSETIDTAAHDPNHYMLYHMGAPGQN